MAHPPIVVCSLTGKTLPVFVSSVLTYAPWSKIILHKSSGETYGESYNDALSDAFAVYDEVIISCDDVVLTPDSLELLMEDVTTLKERYGKKLGLVGSYADNSRGIQSIRHKQTDEDTVFAKWTWESRIRETKALSPLFCWISKHAFNESKFPPINWFSDDVICFDLSKKGYRHFISRSYVQHAGSQTIGQDDMKSWNDAAPWIRENRPEYAKQWRML